MSNETSHKFTPISQVLDPDYCDLMSKAHWEISEHYYEDGNRDEAMLHRNWSKQWRDRSLQIKSKSTTKQPNETQS